MKTRSFLMAVTFVTMAFTLCSCGGSKRIASTEIGAVCSQLGSVKDKDGNTYKTAKIGEDEWMVENLKTSAGNSKCYDGIEGNCEKYGRLYDLRTANEICPDGWELPVWGDYKKLGEMYGEIRKFPWMSITIEDAEAGDERGYISNAMRNCSDEANRMDYRAKVNERGTQLTREDVIGRCEKAKSLAISGMENRRNPETQIKQIQQRLDGICEIPPDLIIRGGKSVEEALNERCSAEKEAIKERDRCGFFEIKGGICEESGVCLFKDLEGYFYTRKPTIGADVNAVKLTRDNRLDDVYPVAGIQGEINANDLRSVRCIRKKK